jgi:class 3 adenylate cyclase
MVDDARTGAAAAAYRGFLFSDIRGFTAFAERYGNSAAAAKVNRFLEIARTAIARHEGAELKTEGDAIHAVFPSASSAVLCGLEIVDTAAEMGANEPDGWFDLGVGVHAGEAVETADGYIGRAVNIAARLCAVAKPGEVLVSSTVKGIMQSSIPIGFIPRGRRRLKGIHDPILVYAVTRDMNAKAPRAVPRPVAIGAAGVAVAVFVGIALVVASQLFTTGGPSRSPTPPPARPVAIGALDIGTYAAQAFQPPITFTIGDTGWIANRDQADVFALIRDTSPRGGVTFLRVEQVFTNPCVAEGAGTQTGLGASDLLAALAGITHLSLSTPQAVEVGGYPGQQVEINVAQEALSACGGLAGAEVPLLGAGEEVWSAASAEHFRLIAVDVGGQPVTIVLSADYTQTPSTQELENLLEQGQRIVGTVGFAAAP